MLIVHRCIPQGQGLASALLQRSATVTLDWDTRQKSRFDCTDNQARRIGVFLPRGTVIRGGDVLLTQCSQFISVAAAPQAVLRITPCAQHGSPFDLVRAAYHLGNRHVPIELQPTHLHIEPDHVLADMLCMMHLTVESVSTPFEPESGAYTSHHSHHGHAHAHGHHSHDSAHGHGD
jgi:urease accessory protein